VPDEVREILARRVQKAGLTLQNATLEVLAAYFELLRKWNDKISLTSLPVAEVGDEAVDRLIVEPCLAARYLPTDASTVVDLGSGGGSPAIPLRIVADISILMVESKTRKAAFLRESIRHLGLTKTKVESSRFEDLSDRPELHGFADVVTMRAVRVDEEALSSIWPFLKPGGALFLFTSSAASAPRVAQQDFNSVAHPLIPQLGSQLHLLTRAAISLVPRGTLE
jgi:16S rRNA (guanine527-N7)-methyltransferase